MLRGLCPDELYQARGNALGNDRGPYAGACVVKLMSGASAQVSKGNEGAYSDHGRFPASNTPPPD
jgi:hypothetical protein